MFKRKARGAGLVWWAQIIFPLQWEGPTTENVLLTANQRYGATRLNQSRGNRKVSEFCNFSCFQKNVIVECLRCTIYIHRLLWKPESNFALYVICLLSGFTMWRITLEDEMKIDKNGSKNYTALVGHRHFENK